MLYEPNQKLNNVGPNLTTKIKNGFETRMESIISDVVKQSRTRSDLLCDPEPLDGHPCPPQFEDVRAIVGLGRGTDDEPRRHTVDPHAVSRPLHRQGAAQVLHAGPSGSCGTSVGGLLGMQCK